MAEAVDRIVNKCPKESQIERALAVLLRVHTAPRFPGGHPKKHALPWMQNYTHARWMVAFYKAARMLASVAGQRYKMYMTVGGEHLHDYVYASANVKYITTLMGDGGGSWLGTGNASTEQMKDVCPSFKLLYEFLQEATCCETLIIQMEKWAKALSIDPYADWEPHGCILREPQKGENLFSLRPHNRYPLRDSSGYPPIPRPHRPLSQAEPVYESRSQRKEEKGTEGTEASEAPEVEGEGEEELLAATEALMKESRTVIDGAVHGIAAADASEEEEEGEGGYTSTESDVDDMEAEAETALLGATLS